MIVYVDIPKNPEAFLWRPAPNMTRIEDAVGSAIAWPANKVELEKIRESQDVGNASSPSSVSTRSNKKCKLLDVDGSREIVAEGRWSSSDPNQVVHFIPLGPNAMRVWVDIAKVPSASLWRQSSELQTIEDAFGTTVAWPADKVIMS
ncbi:hypothetical protein ACLB2K_068194 [Fragaria x ananassa]